MTSPIDARDAGPPAHWRARMDLTAIVAVMALVLSGLSFYWSYIYTKQQLDMTVTSVSYVTEEGGLYMTVAFSNAGNRDAALLRVEPALWSRHGTADPSWVPLTERVHPNIPLTAPKVPTVVRAGGVEVVTVSTMLRAEDAGRALVASEGGAFLGIRVATMNSDGNLYLVEHAVARLVLDRQGKIHSAEPVIHQSLSGFVDQRGAPPGDRMQANKKTPFVWADEQP
jgi:hypothetical protein